MRARTHARGGDRAVGAAEHSWTLAGPGIYSDLVDSCGWSAQDYEQWLASQLRFALLGTGRSRSSSSRARKNDA